MKLFASIWSVLSLLFLPFSFQFLPQIGVGLSIFILPLNEKICAMFGVNIQNSFLVSDSLASFSTGFILLLVSLVVTIFCYWKGEKIRAKIQKVLFFTLLFFVSYFLLHYGLDKLFRLQFYTPASNTLHTPVGQLDKDILFWTSMGTSAFYNQFMAILEITVGILLLFNCTRFLALIIAFGTFLNIFALNIGFDITVKYLSGLLLISSFVCLSFYADNIRFLFGKTTHSQVVPHLSQSVILVLFIPFTLDLGVTYWNVQPKNSGKSYLVKSISKKSQLIDSENIVRVHFHPENYFITEDKHQKFTSYKLKDNQKTVIINNQNISISMDNKQLIWSENGKKNIWEIHEIDLQKMPLKQDKTHCFFEEIGR